MRIRQLTAHVVRLPFKRAFRHASAARQDSENVLVRCELADGTFGWGEGVPRPYVTGETPAGCIDQLASTALGDQLGAECGSWTDVVRLCEGFSPAAVRADPRGCYGNALRCAVELSILNAFGRLFGEPSGNVASHFEIAAPILRQSHGVEYSAVIDSGNQTLWRKSLVRRLYGFGYCKIKVGAAGDNDVERLRIVRRWSGRKMDLRLDANEAWSTEDVCRKLEPLKQFSISAIEQPVAHGEVERMAELRALIGIPVILDESLTSMVDAERAIQHGTCDLFNIRLSKCGGFLNSLRLAARASAASLGYQLGCHPGESGVLSAAGRHWACRVKNVRYLEGSYDRFLFRRLLTNEDMTFGYGGRAAPLAGPGFGVTINEAVLRDCTVSRCEFPLE